MPKRRYLKLTKDERQALETVRDGHHKPYMRERACALLKIAAGHSAHQVAHTGLLRTRDPDTLYRWLDLYESAGIAGLAIKTGRGRKPAFSPSI